MLPDNDHGTSSDRMRACLALDDHHGDRHGFGIKLAVIIAEFRCRTSSAARSVISVIPVPRGSINTMRSRRR
jgi:hypothetical protein